MSITYLTYEVMRPLTRSVASAPAAQDNGSEGNTETYQHYRRQLIGRCVWDTMSFKLSIEVVQYYTLCLIRACKSPEVLPIILQVTYYEINAGYDYSKKYLIKVKST